MGTTKGLREAQGRKEADMLLVFFEMLQKLSVQEGREHQAGDSET